MARPTEEPKTRVIRLRISEELASQLGTGNKSERVRELIQIGLNSFVPQNESPIKPESESFVPQNKSDEEGFVPQNETSGNSFVPQNLDKETMEDIERMCFFSGLSVKEFISKLCEAMNEGTIRYEDGKFITESGYDLSRLEEACHEKNIPVQKAIEKCIQMIWKS